MRTKRTRSPPCHMPFLLPTARIPTIPTTCAHAHVSDARWFGYSDSSPTDQHISPSPLPRSLAHTHVLVLLPRRAPTAASDSTPSSQGAG